MRDRRRSRRSPRAARRAVEDEAARLEAWLALMYIGAHSPPSGGIHTAIDRAVAIGAESVQVFTQSPRAWRPTNHDPANFDRFRERRAEAGIHGVLCHALYLCNLAAPDDAVYEKSVAALRQHDGGRVRDRRRRQSSSTSARISAPASTTGSSASLPALEQVLELSTDETWLLMENSAGTGGTIGRSIDELATIYERLDAPSTARHLPRLVPSLRLGRRRHRSRALDALLDEVDATIGLDRLRALHVNDSATPLGSNRDRHANIGEGLLGEKLGVFLANPRLQGLPAVLETAGPEKQGPGRERGAKDEGDPRARAIAG